MTGELVRAVVAVPVATLLSISLPGLERQAWRCLTVILVTLALANHLERWQTWAVVGVAGLATIVISSIPSAPPLAETADLATRAARPRAGAKIVALALAATALVAVLVDGSRGS